jgi:ABC-type amino acid transport substrate-binding protein/uncharacterized Zn-finger protein
MPFARVVPVVALALFSAQARADETVRLGNLKFAHYGAVSYMKNHCKKFGLDVQEIVFPKGIDIFPAIVKGEVDLAASAADAAIANRAGGGQVFVVAGFARGGARLVGRTDLELRSVADLKGKKVGVARGGAQELLLLAELSKARLTWSDRPGKDVQLVYLPFADLNQALMQKQVDAMCQSEPQSSQASELEEDRGHAPGPHFRKALESWQVEEGFLGLRANRVCFPTGRRVFDAGGNGFELACPFCGATFTPGSEWSNAVGAWYEGADEASFPCPFCGKVQRLTAWRGPWPGGFGCLALEFWNWPPLSARFVEEVGRRLEHRIVLVRCHI